MADDKKKLGNLQKMKDALKSKPKSTVLQTPCPVCKLPMQMSTPFDSQLVCGNRQCKNFKKPAKLAEVAAAATPKKPPKNNHRTAKARDIRAKKRGRLPIGVQISYRWNGSRWLGVMDLRDIGEALVKSFANEADGQFRCAEELDCRFWEWYAKTATAEEKARLVFAPDPPSPAPWPSPSEPVDTAPESH